MAEEIDWKKLKKLFSELERFGQQFPAPTAPEFKGYDISPGQEASILADIQRGIGKQTRTGLRTVRHGTARRGMFRSGQRLRQERKVVATGQKAAGSAFAQFYTGKANRLANLGGAKASFDLNKWQTLFRNWQMGQTGRGEIIGSEFGRGG